MKSSKSEQVCKCSYIDCFVCANVRLSLKGSSKIEEKKKHALLAILYNEQKISEIFKSYGTESLAVPMKNSYDGKQDTKMGA